MVAMTNSLRHRQPTSEDHHHRSLEELRQEAVVALEEVEEESILSIR